MVEEVWSDEEQFLISVGLGFGLAWECVGLGLVRSVFSGDPGSGDCPDSPSGFLGGL